MHALISYEVARLVLDDRLKAADDARLAYELRTPRSRTHSLRSSVGRRLMAFGARMASPTQAPPRPH